MMALSSNESVRWGARWLAAIGVALLGVAAVSLVSDRWQQFGPGARLAILLGASGVVFVGAQLLRRLAPETTRALDVLVATLVPIDVAALVIVSGGTWRSALVAAGPAAVISSETLRRRDPTFITELGTAAGGVLTMCGFAALYDVSAPVLVAGLGLVAVLVAPGGRDRSFGVIWAAVAGLTPALRVLDDAVFTGMGTMRDLGLLDAAEPWETLTAGILATAALSLAAVVQQRIVIGLTAVATAAATGLQLWGHFDPPGTVALLAVAIALGGAELAFALPAVRRMDDETVKVLGDINAVATGMLTLVVTSAAWVHLTEDEPLGSHLQYTAAVLAVVWLIGDLRRAFFQGQRGLDLYLVGGNWAPALPGFVASVASAAYLGTERALVLGVALGALGVLSISTLRPGRLATAIVALTASAFLTDEIPEVTVVVSAIATWGIAYAATLLVRREDRAVAAFVGAVGLVTVVPGAVAADEWSTSAAGIYVVAVVWGAARLLDSGLPGLARAFRVLAHVGLLVVAVDHLWVAALSAAVVTVGHELEHRERGGQFHRVLAVASAMLVWLFGIGAAGVDVVDLYVLPPLWLVLFGLVRLGLERPWAVGLAGWFTLVTTVTGRLDDGRPVHSLILGVAALALAGWGAVQGERAALAVGGAVAVATAAYEGLARSVGVETWGWLVVGGTAAITAASLLEVHGRSREDDAAADEAFVS